MPDNHIIINDKRFLLVPEPEKQLTVPELVEKLRMPGDQSVICRAGQRGRLTGELKKNWISTKQKRLENGDYLFQRCEARNFKK